MHKLLTIGLVLGVLGLGFVANADTISDTVDIYEYSVGGSVNWSHTLSVDPGDVLSATLTITADDVDQGENNAVYLNGSYLGELDDQGFYSNWGYTPGVGGTITSTTFVISPAILAALNNAVVNIETDWGAEIETSTLTVVTAAVPEPGAALVFGIGTVLVGSATRRRRS